MKIGKRKRKSENFEDKYFFEILFKSFFFKIFKLTNYLLDLISSN